MLEKNPTIIKIHHDVTLKYLMFSINSHNLSIVKLTKYSTNIDIYILLSISVIYLLQDNNKQCSFT